MTKFEYELDGLIQTVEDAKDKKMASILYTIKGAYLSNSIDELASHCIQFCISERDKLIKS